MGVLAALVLGAALAAPKTAQDLVPKGYKLIAQASGDLDGDRRPDVAIVAGSDLEGTGEPETWASQPKRKLIVGQRQKDGSLRVWAASDRAAMGAHDGGVFGDPFEGLAIKAGELVLNHYGGSRNRWAFEDRYRWQGGAFQHVLATKTDSDTLEPTYYHARRDDLTTRLVTIQDGEGKGAKRQAFAEVWAPRGAAGAFAGPVTAIGRAAHVVAGRGAWSDADDASFLVAATRVGDVLHLRVQVSDDQATPADRVVVLDEQGKPVAPATERRDARPRGYDWVATFPLAKLGLAAAEERLKQYHEGRLDPARDLVIPLTIEVHDGDGGPVTILSTSQGGRKYPGNLRLRAEARTPRLGDYTRTDGEQTLTDPRPEGA